MHGIRGAAHVIHKSNSTMHIQIRQMFFSRTLKYVERAITFDPNAGFSFNDNGPRPMRIIFSPVISPAVMAQSCRGPSSASGPAP